eukprot:TRINITY_DN2043_c0_g2_i2.p2 TRINITY_DN2043_c0_g2~~TRINITY_DN2043_c0_g2_i2.p2  ORF type:complete len:280 (+),score=130.30 TRINITY_DN2043_c0_g2_i2:63-902(+)
MATAPDAAPWAFATLAVEDLGDGVLHVQLNRPKKRNAMNSAFWTEYRECFERVRRDTSIRAVVVSGNGKMFSAGLDLTDTTISYETKDVARRAHYLNQSILVLQEAFTAMERCPQPVIVVPHTGCYGGAVDLIAACDIRYTTQDCVFSIKEVDVGLAADVGTLQRLPKMSANHGLLKELAYTARNFTAQEALELGLATRVFPTKDAALGAAVATAKTIAAKSPVAVAGTKEAINYARDHTVEEGLRQIALWNAAMLQTEDVTKSAMAMLAKKKVKFAKL